MASGLLGSSTMLGNAAGSLFTVWLVIQAGLSWQLTYVIYGGMGVVWAFSYLGVVPERKGVMAIAPPMTGADWRTMLHSAPLWLLCGQQFFRAGAMIFFINWFPVFLKEERGFGEYDAGYYAFVVSIAALLGGICGGFASDFLLRLTDMRRLSRQGIAVFGMTAAGTLVVATYFIKDREFAVLLFAVGAFIATFGGVSGYTVAIELGGTRIGVVFSMMNMCGNFAGAIVNYIAGSLTERTGSWNPALFVIAGIFAVDAVCWALLNPKEPLFREIVGNSISQETGIHAGELPALRSEHETR
jgi:nitrate/nitrite transporter NarK